MRLEARAGAASEGDVIAEEALAETVEAIAERSPHRRRRTRRSVRSRCTSDWSSGRSATACSPP